MSLDQLFSLNGTLVMPFWALMVFLPRWRWTQRIVQSPLVVLGPVLIYTVLVAPRVAGLMSEFGSLADVAALLGTPFGATVAWAHFLAFDLFVGRWAYLDSRQRAIHPLVMAPVLFATFMFGPIGYLCYLAVRAATAFSGRHAGAASLAVGR